VIHHRKSFCPQRVVERRPIARTFFGPQKVAPGGAYDYKAGIQEGHPRIIATASIERSYAIAASPYERALEFFSSMVPAGQLTPLLTSSKDRIIPPLSPAFCQGPLHPSLDLKSGTHHSLLLGTVTGVRPMSVCPYHFQDWKRRVALCPASSPLFAWPGSARRTKSAIATALKKIATLAPWFTYVPTITSLGTTPRPGMRTWPTSTTRPQ